MFTKVLNHVLLAALLLGGAFFVCAAETKRAPGGNPREQMDKLIEVLELTNEQQWKLQDEYRYQMERAKEIQADANLSREQKDEELKLIRENIELKMKEILTPAQLTKWQALREKMQATQTPEASGTRNRMEAIAAELKLTDEQKSKLKDVLQGQAEKFKELHASTNLTNEQKMQEYKAIQEKIDPQVKEILTPEQFAKWQALREKMQAAQTQAASGIRNRLEAIAAELKLTDEQKAKLKEVFQGPTEQVKALRANTNLSPEEKMKEYQAIQDKVDPLVKEILTPEQFAKWQAEREKWRAEVRQKLGKQQ
jgi:Spy/CpxP family protein refolding chaperone